AVPMVDAVMLENDSNKQAELSPAQKISDLSPPDSQRNSLDEGSGSGCSEERREIMMEEEVGDENRLPNEVIVGAEEEIVDVGKNCDDPPATPSSISDIVSLHGLPLSPSILAAVSPSLTVAGAVASDKAKQRAIATAIEKCVERKGGNLYPTREDKEKMAEELNVSYIQVNRWFANRRRKVTKHRKILGCSSPVGRGGEEEKEQEKDNVDECIEAIIEENRRKRRAEDDEEEEERRDAKMVANNEIPEASVHYSQDQLDSVPAPMGTAATAAMLAAAMTPGAAQGLSPYLLATLMSNPQITAQLLQQVLHQQQLFVQMQQQHALYANQAALASPVHHVTVNAHGQPTWMSPPISESPLEELSDRSEFSPRPSSPRFKDPHNIADPQMAKLLAATDLSEKESIAIAVLTEMANARY
ncbi:hypothetical protein PFISCL1PPCAC_18890, partial [Pristionchus fissidentatus]